MHKRTLQGGGCLWTESSRLRKNSCDLRRPGVEEGGMRRAGSRKTLQLLSAAISNYRGVASDRLPASATPTASLETDRPISLSWHSGLASLRPRGRSHSACHHDSTREVSTFKQPEKFHSKTVVSGDFHPQRSQRVERLGKTCFQWV